MTPAEFEKSINGPVQLLDVRTMGEFSSGHLKNALQADWNDQNEFSRRIGFIDKQKPVYVYCLSGARSAAAAAKMRSLGYTSVYELKGGINAWKAENKYVEGNATGKQMSIAELDKAISKSTKVVLLDFGAEWCPPCKQMEPVLKSLENNQKGKFSLIKIDGGRDEAILKKYNVTALPVFIVLKDGKQVWRNDGVADEKTIAAHL
ncbi:thioredoxin domain-containing protein [soil metagenome]